MLDNLLSRGCVLAGAGACQDKSTQIQRFVENGWDSAQCWNMNEVSKPQVENLKSSTPQLKLSWMIGTVNCHKLYFLLITASVSYYSFKTISTLLPDSLIALAIVASTKTSGALGQIFTCWMILNKMLINYFRFIHSCHKEMSPEQKLLRDLMRKFF